MKPKFALLTLCIAVHVSAPAAFAQSTFVEHDTDREWAQVAKEHPGFAGYYIDDAGRTVLMVSDAQRIEALKSEMLGSAKSASETAESESVSETLITREVAFDYAQLYAYKQQLHNMLSEPGVVYVDLDEVNNRIVVGIDPTAPRARIASTSNLAKAAQTVASTYKVPERAVAIVPAEPIMPLATLRSRLRPTPGGMQISNASGGLCTMGVVVQRGAVNGFLTNSHCTNVKGGVEGTRFYQPTFSSNNLIGTEVADPPYLTGGACPVGRRCRNSDSALVQFTNNNMSLGQWGYIAKPPCYNCNDLSISTQYPRLSMVYNNYDFAVGDTVQKVGRTTGWTRGPVTNTCVTANATDNTTLFCQHYAQMGASFGDSGSAIIRGSHRQRRGLSGLLWGGSGSSIVFSSRVSVESDIGTVDVWP